jgi:hypothetical protein
MNAVTFSFSIDGAPLSKKLAEAATALGFRVVLHQRRERVMDDHLELLKTHFADASALVMIVMPSDIVDATLGFELGVANALGKKAMIVSDDAAALVPGPFLSQTAEILPSAVSGVAARLRTIAGSGAADATEDRPVAVAA